MKGSFKVILFALIILVPLFAFQFHRQSFSVDDFHGQARATRHVRLKLPHDIQEDEASESLSTLPPLSTTKAPKRRTSPAAGNPDCKLLDTDTAVSTAFDVTLCYSPLTCSGHMHILHKNCSSLPPSTKTRPLSPNATLSTWIRSTHGANEFRLRIEGPEVHAFRSILVSSCSYILPIPQLKHKGKYNLGLEWLYEYFYALDEVTNHYPPIKKQPLLLRDPAHPFQTRYHIQQCTVPSREYIECPKSRSTLLVSDDEGTQKSDDQGYHDATDKKGEVPVYASRCSGHEPDSSGRWVVDEPAGTVTTRVRVKKVRKQPILFEWALQLQAAAHWVPEQCNAARLKHTQLQELLHGKKVIIGGDSQLRALYYTFVNFLNGYGNECVRNITTQDAEPGFCIQNVKGSQRKSIYSIPVDFVDDHYLDKLGSGRYQGYDVVIVGFAQHPASKEHWVFDKYRRHVHRRTEQIVKLKTGSDGKGPLIVWYLAPQYPHTQKGYPVVVRDWRTDSRLQLFNNYSAAVMHSAHIPVLDAFAISTPMSHSSPDQAHFSNFVAYEFMQMLANIMTAHFDKAG